ncbi:hypothetical protein ACE1SV_62640 [Streptomyces sennicomposti]
MAARLRLRDTPVRTASRSSPTPSDWFHSAGSDQVLRDVTTAYIVPPARARSGARLRGAGRGRRGAAPGPALRSRRRRLGRLRVRAGHALGEDAVRGSALAWTILRPSNFAQNFDGHPFRAPLAAGEPALPPGAVPEPFTDLEDVAAVAATVLSEPGRHTGRVCELTGSHALTWAETVELISRASGLPIAYRRVSPAEYTATLVQEGWSEDEAQHLAEMFVLLERGVTAWATDDVATVLGRAPPTFEDFVLRATAAKAWQR